MTVIPIPVPYRCPDYDGKSHLLTHRQWVRAFTAGRDPQRLAMIQDDREREMLFSVWKLGEEKKAGGMRQAELAFEDNRYR